MSNTQQYYLDWASIEYLETKSSVAVRTLLIFILIFNITLLIFLFNYKVSGEVKIKHSRYISKNKTEFSLIKKYKITNTKNKIQCHTNDVKPIINDAKITHWDENNNYIRIDFANDVSHLKLECLINVNNLTPAQIIINQFKPK